MRHSIHIVVWLLALALAGAGILSPAQRTPSSPAGSAVPLVPTVAAASGTSGLRRHQLQGPMEAEVVRAIDGDTFEARVRIWFGQEITTLVRLRGIDAPELKSHCAGELAQALAAKQALEEFLTTGTVWLANVDIDKYGGRVVASVIISDSSGIPEDVAGLMLATGMARPYGGGQRQSWCSLSAKVN